MFAFACDVNLGVADQPRQRTRYEGARLTRGRNIGVVQQGMADAAKSAIVAGFGFAEHCDQPLLIGKAQLARPARWRRPPSQGWKTFIRNHADGIASMDLFVVPTISF